MLELHSDNHMRQGPKGFAESADENPDINIGTRTLPEREPWKPLIERFISDLSEWGSCGIPGG